MTLSRFNSEALDGCRMAASAEAGHLGAAGDGAGGITADAGMFGELTGGGELAAAITRFGSNLASEYEAGEQRLRGVERALDAIQLSMSETEAANERGFTAPGS